MEQRNTLYRLEIKQADVPMKDFLESCVEIPYFLGLCKDCRNYNTRWSCPPFDFDPMDIWQQYRNLRLLAYVMYPSTEADVDSMIQAMRPEKEKLLDTLFVQEQEIPDSLVVSAGGCQICARCSKEENQLCRFPKKCRHSIESLGGDVGKAAEKFLGLPTLWIRDGKLPEYLMLVCGLLMK